METSKKIKILSSHLKKKDLSPCIKILENATTEDQKNIQFLFLANDIYRSQKNYKKCLVYSELILERYPERPAGYYRNGQDRLALGQRDEAVAIIKKGLKKYPENIEILKTGAQAFLKLEMINESLACAQIIYEKFPQRIFGFVHSAQMNLKLDLPERALNIIKDGLNWHSHNPQLLSIGIEAATKSNQIEISLTFSDLLREKHPDKPISFIRTAQSLLKAEKPSQALNAAQEGLKLHPTNLHLLSIATSISRELNRPDLISFFTKKLIKTDPNNATHYKTAAQNLSAAGHLLESLELIKELERNSINNINNLEIARDLYRSIGKREKSLQVSKKILDIEPTESKQALELISDLLALGCVEEGIEIGKNYHIITKSIGGKGLEALQNISPIELLPETRQCFKNLKVFPHFEEQNFNLIPSLYQPQKPTICIVHIGKCAGGSVLKALEKTFQNKQIQIIEYHIFDANSILKQAIPCSTDDNHIHWIILTRDPIMRWISSFNWDYHLYRLNQKFYCHAEARNLLSHFNNCLELAKELAKNNEKAILLSKFSHLSFGHMAMGQAWYLNEKLINYLRQERTSLIRTEKIEEDLQNSVRRIYEQFGWADSFEIKLISEKGGYKKNYKPGTFKDHSNFSSYDLESLKSHLNDDYMIHNLLIQKLIKQ